MTDKETFHQARIAIRSGKDARAFLQLGLLYSKGIGTLENHALSLYFMKKAANLGCAEADELLDGEFEERMKDIVSYINEVFDNPASLDDPTIMGRIRRRLVRELKAGNEGCISRQRLRIAQIFPEYDPEQAREDILAGRDTLLAELDYALCTDDNQAETDMDEVEPFLAQYYAPFLKKSDLWCGLRAECVPHGDEEKWLVTESLPDFRSSYHKLCRDHGVIPLPFETIEPGKAFPYVPPSELRRVRRQAYRCLLSLRGLHECIDTDFLPNLNCDTTLLDVSDRLKPHRAPDDVEVDFDFDALFSSLQDEPAEETEKPEEHASLNNFLASFIDINIQIWHLIGKYRRLHAEFTAGNRDFLIRELNRCNKVLEELHLHSGLPVFTAYNLPVEMPETAQILPF